jgi:thiol:disulfide interchange protein DsbD
VNFSQLDDSCVYVALDFSVPLGEEISAPVGKGRQSAPNVLWKNAEQIDEFWPDHRKLLSPGGEDSGYYGYTNDFTVLYYLRVLDPSKPVEYDLTYVSCGNACVPFIVSGEITPNGLVLQDEIDSFVGSLCLSQFNFLVAILLGLLGGLILNCMPCVFPIISMKIFSIAKLSESSKKRIRRHGFSVAIGMISMFVSIGLILLLMRKSSPDLGWGFYMQCPQFVFIILVVFLLCGLHFFNLLSFSIPNIVKPFNLSIKSAYFSSFVNGVFGAISSASCVGPFAGVAVASALLNGTPWQSCCIFSAIGIGAAVPFLLIALFPSCVRILPTPGKWLSVFKEFMGFAMLFSCIWPIWTLTTQIDIRNVVIIISILISIAMCFWGIGHCRDSKVFKSIAFMGLCASIWYGLLVASEDDEISCVDWEEYSDERFDRAIKAKKPVFLNFTASWCINCQLNHRVFEDQEVVDGFKKKSIVAMKCDWSRRNETISRLLKKYGSVSVPLYVFHQSGYTDFKILPNVLTKDHVLKVICGEEIEE